MCVHPGIYKSGWCYLVSVSLISLAWTRYNARAAIVSLSLELMISWNCKLVVRGATEVCNKMFVLSLGYHKLGTQGGNVPHLQLDQGSSFYIYDMVIDIKPFVSSSLDQ